MVEKFADIEILRYEVPGFASLPIETKQFLYYLSEATLWGRDILYIQHHKLNLKLRSLLETLYLHAPAELKAESEYQGLREYLYRVWFASGPHHHYAERKFTPTFSKAFILALYDKLPIPIQRQKGCSSTELDQLLAYIFDPDDAPIRRAHGDHKSIVERSSVNFYDKGITTQEAEAFYQAKAHDYPIAPGLNTRLVRDAQGHLTEEAYCSEEGPATQEIGKIIEALTKAKECAPTPEYATLIERLIAYYRDGDLQHFYDYSIAWISIHEPVDFINGFIETYTDPLGLKGSWEGLVQLQDNEGSKRAAIIAANAGRLEAKSPINAKYKKGEIKGVSARAINVVMLGGDSYPASPLGINLPNDEEIRARFGSKSVSLTNISMAVEEAIRESGTLDAFYRGAERCERIRRYGTMTNMLHTDLHECLGHGSGRLMPGIKGDALGTYDSTIEEARADINALYFMADEEMVRLGLLPDSEAYKAQYDLYMTNALIVQLARLQQGEQLTEAHMQNRALIARYLLEHAPETVRLERGDDGHFYVEINDYEGLHQAMGTLLRLIQEIKSEGDIDKAREMVEKYGTVVDEEIRSDADARYKALHLSPYRGFINPRMTPVYNEEGNVIIDVMIDYNEGYEEQMLRYSHDYSFANHTTKPQGKEKKWKETLATIRQQCTSMMDGAVAQSMRDKGVSYFVNYGVNLFRLRDIAKDLPREKGLAQMLWSKDVREYKILATMIWPHDDLSRSEALELCLTSPYIEVSEQLVINLLMHQSYVEHLTLDLWHTSTERDRAQTATSVQANIIPYILMTRMLMAQTRGYQLRGELLRRATKDLQNEETTARTLYIIRSIERLAERDEHSRTLVRTFVEELALYLGNDHPIIETLHSFL